MSGYAVGYSDAHFEPRNRWGGSKRHAVDPDAQTFGRAPALRGLSLCGLGVAIGGMLFEPDSITSCKRCAAAIRRRDANPTQPKEHP